MCPTDSLPNDVTGLLRAWTQGDAQALDKLIPSVYQELHRLARKYMNRERAGQSMQATALVNEAYIRLVDYKRMQWQDRAHFFAVAAQLMRRILVDRARQQKNLKRGAGAVHIDLEEATCLSSGSEITEIDDALNRLAKIDQRKVQVVEMRFFGGLSVEETAEVMKISTITVIRDWNNAKAWLHRELQRTSHGSNPLEAGR